MKYNIVVIGGGPAGLVCATTARRNYPDKKILVIRKVAQGVIPCAIPYIFGRLGSVDKILMSDSVYSANDIDLLIDTVTKIDPEKRKVTTMSKGDIEFEKLVIATGAKPSIPPIPGIDLKNVFPIHKDAEYLRGMLEVIQKSSSILIIGGGFVGAEIADELARAGKEVYIVEILPHLLYLNFDDEFCVLAEEELRKKGVEIFTNTRVEKIKGNGKAEKVVLSNGEEIKVDAVIVATGTKPNVDLAKDAGIEIGKTGAIKVDEYMRTSHKDIYAIGDCAEKISFYTRKPVRAMLASIATAEARIAGSNLYELKFVNQIRGTIGIFSTVIGDTVLAAAGFTERSAKNEGFDIIVGKAEVFDRHPAAFPDTKKVITKLIVSRQGELILGAEIAGGISVGEMINFIGLAMENHLTLSKIINTQIGTHPLLTPPPTRPPVIMAAIDALSKIR